MNEITLEEFLKLSDKEKKEKVHLLSAKDYQTFRMTYDIPIAQAIGFTEQTEEERQKSKQKLHELIKKYEAPKK